MALEITAPLLLLAGEPPTLSVNLCNDIYAQDGLCTFPSALCARSHPPLFQEVVDLAKYLQVSGRHLRLEWGHNLHESARGGHLGDAIVRIQLPDRVQLDGGHTGAATLFERHCVRDVETGGAR